MSVNERNQEIMASSSSTTFLGRITVYSISGCPHCKRAKAYLNDFGIPYSDIDLDIFPMRRTEMTEKTGRYTVPQIFFNDKHVGGADNLMALSASELQELIRYARENPPNDSTPDPALISAASSDLSAPTSSACDSPIQCEIDKYYELIRQGRFGTTEPQFPSRDHIRGIRTHRLSFTGRELTNWLINQHVMEIPEAEAIRIARDMMNRLFFGPLSSKVFDFIDDDQTLYRLLIDRRSKALNVGNLSVCDGASAEVTAEQLRRSILKLFEQFIGPDGLSVDYIGIKNSEQWPRFVEQTYELQRLSLTGLIRQQKLAFFINIYNVLVIHATIERGPPSSVWKRVKFFSKITYVIGGHEYSLNEIENGILRSNSKSPFGWSRPFSSSDPRLLIAIHEMDPRIHFALVCGAKSCPPIKTYSSSQIDEQLDAATRAYLEGGGFKIKKNHAYLSKIFDWYAADFGGSTATMLRWIYPYLSEENKQNLAVFLVNSDRYSVTFMPYDWSSNSRNKI